MPENTLNIRHYVYGRVGDEEEFITTTLSQEGAVEFATEHKQMFEGRYQDYSIRMNAEKLVAKV